MKAWRNPWTTAALVALAAALPYALRLPARWRPVDPAAMRRAFVDPFLGQARVRPWERVPAPGNGKPQPETTRNPVPDTPAAPERGPWSGPAPAPRRPALLPPDPAAATLLDDPQGALQHFHEALARTEAGTGLTRIAHFGDSVVTGDLITGEARARFQAAYGDGGPGWIYPQRPWEWYGRLGLTLKGRGWKLHSPVLTWRPDHHYGLAGIDFASAAGAETALTTAASLPFDQVELHYLARPGGGSLQVKVDRALDLEVTTDGEPGPAVKTLPLPQEAAHALQLRTKGDAVLYGIVLERRGPGVVLDPLGQNGYAIQHLAKIDREHWIQALRLRRPDLVVLAFGTNEVGYYNIPGPAYAADYREVVRRIREALPTASILVMGPMDRGERRSDGSLGTMPNLIRIVDAQRKIAAELGVAFFDTYRAMGGEGSAARWYQSSPRLMTGDFTHPTRTGADRIARTLVDALVTKHVAWVSTRPSNGTGAGIPQGGSARR